jgi:hydrogenase maturation protein HypF
VVQGVGFRPFVYNTAKSLGLGGWVVNEAATVRIEVEGERTALGRFLEALRHGAPPQSRIDALESIEIPPLMDSSQGRAGEFRILASRAADGQTAKPRPTLPADLATCQACLAEINEPGQRRYRYPFTNCTNCGPRWSIVERLPYDRQNTSMAGFTMCPECRAEYENPGDRRFHAQPIACPRCGPTLQWLDPHGNTLAVGDVALTASLEALSTGQIVALKGLGGFQLLVDATDAAAVERLRQRKHRPARPFAVMMPSLEVARRYCEISEEEARILESPQSPIVLLRRHAMTILSRTPETPSKVSSQAQGQTQDQSLRHALCQAKIAGGVAPGNPYLGVMLPYTPLHHLLLQGMGRSVVCTSGNLSEEPMVVTLEDALLRLGSIADSLLTHDRPIVRPVDDSIVRLGSHGMQVLRRARGFAPLPLKVPGASFFHDGTPNRRVPTILAVGGHLKNTVALCLGGERPTTLSHAGNATAELGRAGECECLCNAKSDFSSAQVVMSSHIGDLESVLSVEVFRRAIDDLVHFFDVKPDAVVCDLHPDYASTRHAEALATRWDVPLLRVQHHHAHVAACIAEHGLTGPELGFSWDGTGYGTDGTVWGGEALLCEGGNFRRAARLRTFPLPGGDQAARQPRRSAFGLLYAMLGNDAADLATAWFTPAEINALRKMMERGLQTPNTSSMGRLFDAVAAIAGLWPNTDSASSPCAHAVENSVFPRRDNMRERAELRQHAEPGWNGYETSFEGQAAMALEYAAEEERWKEKTKPESGRYSFELDGSTDGHDTIVLDWEPMVRAILADRAAGASIGQISLRFHDALADMALMTAQAVGYRQIVLTGGCFQNRLLADRVEQQLSAEGFRVYTHKSVPPGDGGIALGQVLLALRQLD